MKKHLAMIAVATATLAFASVASAQVRLTPRFVLWTPAPIRTVRATPRIDLVTPRAPERIRLARPLTTRLTATRVEPAPAPEPARFDCRVEENGAWAPASFSALRDGQRVASGRCGSAITLEPGTYDVVLTLEETLDRPQRRVRVQAPEGGSVQATASFQTSILEVRFTREREPAAGLAIILRDGEQVGTLGSRVPARLSSGRYEIIARYRTHERRFTVDLAPGQRRAIHAAF